MDTERLFVQNITHTHTHTKQSSGKDIRPTFKSANHQAQSTWIKTNVYLRLV